MFLQRFDGMSFKYFFFHFIVICGIDHTYQSKSTDSYSQLPIQLSHVHVVIRIVYTVYINIKKYWSMTKIESIHLYI